MVGASLTCGLRLFDPDPGTGYKFNFSATGRSTASDWIAWISVLKIWSASAPMAVPALVCPSTVEGIFMSMASRAVDS